MQSRPALLRIPLTARCCAWSHTGPTQACNLLMHASVTAYADALHCAVLFPVISGPLSLAGCSVNIHDSLFMSLMLAGHSADVLDLAWSKSQFLLTASMDKTVRLWHISMDDCLRVFKCAPPTFIASLFLQGLNASLSSGLCKRSSARWSSGLVIAC